MVMSFLGGGRWPRGQHRVDAWGLAVVTALTLGAACGGKAVVDDGGGGDGGTGNTGNVGTGGTGNTGTGGTGNTGTGGTGNTGTGGAGNATSVEEACQTLCGAPAGSCFFDMGCFEQCVSLSTPTCDDPYAALLLCLSKGEGPPNCTFPPECDSLIQDWDQCVNGTCGEQECVGSNDGSCSCSYFCGSSFESVCYPNGGGLTCDCYQDSFYSGTCNGGFQTCDVFEGCCTQFWFLDGDTPPPG
jgi:hypothetical protein